VPVDIGVWRLKAVNERTCSGSCVVIGHDAPLPLTNKGTRITCLWEGQKSKSIWILDAYCLTKSPFYRFRVWNTHENEKHTQNCNTINVGHEEVFHRISLKELSKPLSFTLWKWDIIICIVHTIILRTIILFCIYTNPIFVLMLPWQTLYCIDCIDSFKNLHTYSV